MHRQGREDEALTVALDVALAGLEKAIGLLPPADLVWKGKLLTVRRLLAEEAGRRPVAPV